MRLCGLFFSIFCFSCNYLLADNYNVVVYGKTEPSTKIIRIYTLDYNFNRPDKNVLAIDSIDESGNYKLKLFINEPTVAFLIWDKVILHPNDSVEINFIFNTPYNNSYVMDVVNGNNTIFYRFFYDRLDHWQQRNSKAGCLKVDYHDYFKKNKFQFQKYYRDLAVEAKSVKKAFIDYLKYKKVPTSDTVLLFNEISGEFFSYLLRPFYGLNDTVIIPPKYLSKIILLANDNQVQNYSGYSADAQIFLDYILVKKKSKNFNCKNFFDKSFKISKAYFGNRRKIKDGLYLYLFNKIVNSTDSISLRFDTYFNKYIGTIKMPEYITEAKKLNDFFNIKKRKAFSKNLMSLIFINQQGMELDFKAIFGNAASNYFYLDIWATWCLPCLKEIKDFEGSRKTFDSLNIRRIAISIDTDKNKWSLVSKKLFNETDFTILSKDQQEFRNLLNIETIPRYLIINSKGDILSLNAPKVSEIEKIIELIKPG